jgi:excisionase family DNA binding protein
MDTRQSDGRGPWLRVSEWLRVSAWLPPGLALAWLATLATFIHNTGVMLADWGATVSLVLLVVILARRHAPRRHDSSGATTAKAGVTSPAPRSSVSTGTAPMGAPGPPATPGVSHSPARIEGKGEGSHGGAASPPSAGGTATRPPSISTDPTLPDETYPSAQAGLATPELRVLTAEEVASLLRVDLDLVTRSITSGKLPGNQIGSHWRIDQGALMQWLQGSYEDPRRRDPGH